MESKEQKIEKLCLDMLETSIVDIKARIKKAIDSGAVDVEEWDEKINPYLLPKAIMIAIFERETNLYRPTGTSFEKEVNKEAKNIELFI